MGKREDDEFERLKKRYPGGAPERVLPGYKGILSGAQIQELSLESGEYPLIEPLYDQRLRGASYQLRVGEAYKKLIGKSVRILPLSEHESVTIEPYDVVILQSEETLCIPRNLIGRWNIRASLAYEGLVWVGAPQVDPGWVGHLFAPVYNLSSKPYTLHRGDKFATIDFETTISDDKHNPYRDGPKAGHLTLESYSVPKTGLSEHLHDLERRMDRLTNIERSVALLTGLTLTLVTLLVTAMFATIGQGTGVFTWGKVALSAVVFAVFFVAFALYSHGWFRRKKSIGNED